MGLSMCSSFPVSRQCFFQERDGCLPIVNDPSSQGRLRLLSGTPHRAMEPLEIAAGFLSWEKAPTAQKHFVVILGGATQFHLGVNPHLHFGNPRCNRARTWGWVFSFSLSNITTRVSSNKYTGHPSWGQLYLNWPNSVWGLRH